MSEIQKINKFCDLIKNEDPNFLKELNGLSKESQKIILGISYKYQKSQKNKNSKVSVICELVIRFLSPTPFLYEKLDKLRGPISVYQLSHKEYPHIFYLFGDRHFSKESVCPGKEGLPNYIEELVSYSPVFIDVYIEYQYFYKDYSKTIDYPDVVRNSEMGYLVESEFLFKPCFKKEKVDMCLTSRFHYTDVRHIYETDSQRRGYYILFEAMENASIYDDDKNREDIQNYIDFANNKDSFVYKRLEKQISNIKYPKIKKYVQKLYEKEFSRKFSQKMPVKKSPLSKRMNFTIDLQKFYAYRDNGIFDLYILSRCFREFKKTGAYDFPSYNNIIFAGQQHILTMLENLELLGFKIDFKYEGFDKRTKNVTELDKNKLRCMDISDMKQPLFYQRYKE